MRPEAEILQTAHQQGGVVRRDQALKAGFSERQIHRRVSNGEWVSVNGIGYRLFEIPGRLSLARAAVAVLPGAVASHYSAGALHGIPLVPRNVVSVTVDSSSTHVFPNVRVFRSRDLGPNQVVPSHGMPVTSVPRTAVDLGACLSLRHLEVVVDELLASRMCGLSEIREVLDSVARRGRTGVANMRRVLDERSTGIPDGTPLERSGIRLLVDAGFSGFVAEYQIPWESDRRFDVAFPEHLLAIEWDSVRWHLQKAAFQNDRERDRSAQEHGWRVLRFTWADVHDTPFDVVNSIRMVMEQ